MQQETPPTNKIQKGATLTKNTSFKSKTARSRKFSIFRSSFLTEAQQRGLDFMEFESKTRQMMVDMIEPVMNKRIEDREHISTLELADKKICERLNLLEVAVFNKQ